MSGSCSELHHYSFTYDGRVFYKRCDVLKIDHPAGKPIRITYVPVANDKYELYYVNASDIDRNVATCSSTKTVVLTEPDFEKAKRILKAHLLKRADEIKEQAERMIAQAERLDDLRLVEDEWDGLLW